ncbi:MAG: hypothetical protein J0M08_04580 [Bacteroidetes bacterium]|nr:hypothetical protein [Bacteroidota bacterium]
MSYKILTIYPFDKQLKRLAKKYPSLINDLNNLGNELEQNPFQGSLLLNNCYKIRLAISSKGKGKSGGARIITHIHITGSTVYLLAIYDKSEQSSISNKQILQLVNIIEK